ncbi:MAG: MurR/RpiR family transcriptional regulator [Thomasclavelia sp.]|nr:MurR/RpiR family transcriptional regulator [Tissierellia bacterium]MDD8049223.1 MurR/RpiR family transcriptional regulator [Thomasclavelia sp.]
MLLIDEMKQYPFSNSERIVVDYILENKEKIKDYSTKQIAEATYTSPSILIRIAKKLSFKGWNDLKAAYLDELTYLNSHFTDIDANMPFNNQDSITTIANKISKLHSESINDTLSLINHDSLQKAVQIMRKSSKTNIFGISNMNFLAMNFAFKLKRIGKDVECDPISENLFQNASMATKSECAVCISYSGQTLAILKVARILKKNNVPIIAITSMGNNDLSKLADVTLNISTRERSYSKIGAFTSEESINLILDILFSCLFSLNYQANLDYKLAIASQIEVGRVIDNPIIEEKVKED